MNIVRCYLSISICDFSLLQFFLVDIFQLFSMLSYCAQCWWLAKAWDILQAVCNALSTIFMMLCDSCSIHEKRDTWSWQFWISTLWWYWFNCSTTEDTIYTWINDSHATTCIPLTISAWEHERPLYQLAEDQQQQRLVLHAEKDDLKR